MINELPSYDKYTINVGIRYIFCLTHQWMNSQITTGYGALDTF